MWEISHNKKDDLKYISEILSLNYPEYHFMLYSTQKENSLFELSSNPICTRNFKFIEDLKKKDRETE